MRKQQLLIYIWWRSEDRLNKKMLIVKCLVVSHALFLAGNKKKKWMGGMLGVPDLSTLFVNKCNWDRTPLYKTLWSLINGYMLSYAVWLHFQDNNVQILFLCVEYIDKAKCISLGCNTIPNYFYLFGIYISLLLKKEILRNEKKSTVTGN